MKWIQLHLQNGFPVLVNLETVTSINRDFTCQDQDTAPTVISFAGNSENMIVVKETFSEVRKAVRDMFPL